MKPLAKALQRDQSGTRNTGYISNAPASGTRASNLIGAKVITGGDEELGSVNDLVIDRDGQVVGVVIGVGGFLGMGKRTSPSPGMTSRDPARLGSWN